MTLNYADIKVTSRRNITKQITTQANKIANVSGWDNMEEQTHNHGKHDENIQNSGETHSNTYNRNKSCHKKNKTKDKTLK